MRRPLLLFASALLAACAGGQTGGSPTAAPSTTVEPGLAAVGACWSAPAADGSGPLAFADATDEMGLVDPLTGMYGHAAALADVDADGWLDLFVGSFADRPPEQYEVRGAGGPSPDRLLLGGPSGFRVAEDFPDERGRTSGGVFADLDTDADLDLVVTRNARQGMREAARTPSAVYQNEGNGRFSKVATLLPDRRARGVAVLDYNGDGLPDLFVGIDDGGSVLLRNQGQFSFEDVTSETGLPDDLVGYGTAAADMDGDSFTDLLVAGSNRVFAGSDDGSFDDVTPDDFDWQTTGGEDLVTGVSVGDVDRDARPDVVVGHHFGTSTEQGVAVPVRLWRNESSPGSIVLREVTSEAGLPEFATKAPHVELADFDSDGWVDLLVTASAGDGSMPAVLRNLGAPDGEAVRFAEPEGLGSSQYWVTGAVGDVDHDGRLDVFAVEFDPSLPSVLWRNTGPSGHWISADLGAEPGAGVGSTVAVYESGQAGDDEAYLGGGPVVASAGYAAGTAPMVRVGLGDVDEVDIVIRGPDGREHVLAEVAADRVVRPGGCA